MGIVATHKWREPVGDPPSAAYRDVSFKASDGLDIAGWYRPSRNGAAVFVVRGGSSDRKGSLHHAEMLARHGYGVLVYDARGRGESGGSENTTAGTGPRTSRARSRSSSAAPTSTRPGSAPWGSRPAPM
jgi:alpha-beta hydrolase superfamily lysophospholipase